MLTSSVYNEIPMNSDTSELVKKLSLEEKASLCSGAEWMKTVGIERLNVPQLILSDGPHGIRIDSEKSEEGEITTCFPTASTMGSTWNENLIEEVGQTLGKECLKSGIDVLLAPGVNMKRSPLGGRNFEYYSEDPYLAGEIGKAFVKGVQSQGVGTSLKHYVANNQEFQRMKISAEIRERVLREIYLPAFEQIVKETKPWTVMCAYNKVNGKYASENPYLLNQILREEWNFDGIVISDWGAVNDRIKGLKAGLDLEMPGPSPDNDKDIIEAVKSGELEEKTLDRAVKRILKIVLKAEKNRNPSVKVNSEKHHELAKKVACEGMVLLKNKDKILPLNDEALDSISVIGRTAKEPRIQGGGSSEVKPEKLDIPLNEIKHTAENTEIKFARGYEGEERETRLIEEAKSKAKQSDVAILFLSVPRKIESEGFDRPHMKIPKNQIELLREISQVQSNVVVVLNNGSAVEMKSWLHHASALLEAWLPGEAGGSAIADILFGDENPSGKLQETLPKNLRDNPSFLNFPGEKGKVHYGEGLFIGYRYYDEKRVEPMFPFGFGLSYTEFEYSELKTNKDILKSNDRLEVTMKIENTGEYKGKEIVQLYVKEKNPDLQRPEKELKSFEKIELSPGEEKQVKFTLRKRDFAHYDPEIKKWRVSTGEYEVLIGSSSQDLRERKSIQVISTDQQEPPLNKYSSWKEWVKSDIGKQVLRDELPSEFFERIDSADENTKERPLYKLILLSQGKVRRESLNRALNAYNKRIGE